MAETMRILLDIGFNTTKVQGEGRPKKFLSTIKKHDNDFRQADYVLECKGQKYLVGEIDGRGSSDNDRSQDEVFEICLLNAIASQLPTAKEYDVRIVTGLPMKTFKKKSNRMKLVDKFVSKEPYSVVLNGKRRNFKITKMVIFPQGAGLDLLDSSLTEGEVMVMDIGGGTFDVSIFRDGKWVDGDSKRIGVNSFNGKVLSKIERQYGVEYDHLFEAEKIVKRGKIIANEVEVDITDITKKEKTEKAEELIETAKTMFPTYWTTSKKVAIGGGAELLKEDIKKKVRCAIPKDSEFINLKIYGEVGRLKNV